MLPPRLAGSRGTLAPQQELFLPSRCTHAPPAKSPALPVPSTVPCSRLGPRCSWGQALLASSSTLQLGGMQKGPLPFICGHHFCRPHPPPCAKLFCQPDKYLEFVLYEDVYVYMWPLLFPPPQWSFQAPGPGPSSELRAPWGIGAGSFASQLFDGQGPGKAPAPQLQGPGRVYEHSLSFPGLLDPTCLEVTHHSTESQAAVGHGMHTAISVPLLMGP